MATLIRRLFALPQMKLRWWFGQPMLRYRVVETPGLDDPFEIQRAWLVRGRERWRSLDINEWFGFEAPRRHKREFALAGARRLLAREVARLESPRAVGEVAVADVLNEA